MLFEKIKLENDEKMLRVVHKHWFVLFGRTVGIIITALLPAIAWITLEILLQAEQNPLHIDLSQYLRYFTFFYSMWLLCSWMTLAYIFTDIYLDIWVITDRRIISIDQKGFFRRHIGSFRLEKLQDVNIAIDGIIATFLNYGTVEAQTASDSEDEFRSFYLPKPRELKAIILEAADSRMLLQNIPQQQSD